MNSSNYDTTQLYSIYVKIEGILNKDYFLFIDNKNINIENNITIKNIEHDTADILYNYITNKLCIKNTNQLNLS